MEPTTAFRPRVSRETRLLLTAAVVAIAVLWLLARIRFRDRPVPPSPIPAVLGQLTGGPKLEELATEVADLASRLRSTVVAIEVGPGLVTDTTRRAARLTGLRVRDDVAVAWLAAPAGRGGSGLIAVDRAAGIAVFRAPGPRPTPAPALWVPRASSGPRYLLATEVVGTDVALRPTFMASFEPIETPLWPEPVWTVPAGSDLAAGCLVFTSDGEIVGLVIPFAGRLVIVPAATLLAQAERLMALPQAPAGTFALQVQPLTPALSAATGSTAGVVVTWVDDTGPAHGRLKVGDVIEAVDGRPVTTRGGWDVVAARLSVGSAVSLRVRSRGVARDVALVAAPATPAATDLLGLTLRARAREGAEVLTVAQGSAGERAGLAAGDVITLIDDVAAPTPRQVTRTFAALRPGRRVLVGVARSDSHLVTTFERSQ